MFYALQARIAELHAAAAAAARSITPGGGADGGTSPQADQGGRDDASDLTSVSQRHDPPPDPGKKGTDGRADKDGAGSHVTHPPTNPNDPDTPNPQVPPRSQSPVSVASGYMPTQNPFRSSSRIKLPKMKITHFDGSDILDYGSFRDEFQNHIGNNDTLTDVAKLK